MTRNGQAVLFDCNGVIVNDEREREEAFRIALAAHGCEVTDEEFRRMFMGRTEVDGITGYARSIGRALDARAIMERRAAEYRRITAAGVPVYEDAVKAIRVLRLGGMTLAVGSASLRDELSRNLRRAAVEQCFDAVVGAEDIEEGRGKPAPDVYLEAARRINADPRRCVVVEDSPAGVAAGKAAGALVLAVTHTHGREQLGEADVVVDTLDWRDVHALQRRRSAH